MAALSVAACTSPEEAAESDIEAAIAEDLPEGADVEVDAQGRSLRVQSDGTEFAQGEELPRPEWLPAEIPLPSDLTITSTLVVDQFRTLRGATDASAEEIRDLYESVLSEEPYTIEQAWDPNGPIALKARHESGDPVSIEFGGAELAIVLGRE